MASKKLVALLTKEWLGFSPKKMTTEDTESLIKTYFTTFNSYTDQEIKQASDDYSETGEFFPPKPSQILALVKSVGQSKHTRDLIERYTCILCHQKVSAISEGLCLNCAAVSPAPKYKHNSNIPIEKSDYAIEANIQCQECGHIGLCIKEPAFQGSWRCRQCYTGLKPAEIAKRFKDLIRMSGDKNFTPSWIDKPPF